jgi:Caspase domain
VKLCAAAPAVLAASAVLVLSRPAAAQVERYGVVIGHNEGARGEVALRYAEDDAGKVHDVLRDLGGFAPENLVLLRGADADTVRGTLIAVNDRVRSAAQGGQQALLFVYYSGHADAAALHLGGSLLRMGELERLVRGSSATVRLLVVDSCRSGALTRVKGGRREAAFRIQIDERLAGEGAVFLTSSSANEDAQESDELRGSFFTHYLVSGLLGLADTSGDDRVSLEEAYRHAYRHTLAASSRTLAGPQHPTFRYDLRGQGDLVLTALARPTGRWATVGFPAGRGYLLFRGGRDGPVVAEVGALDRRRHLRLKAGTYFVVGRGADHLLEGPVTVAEGQSVTVQDGALRRIEYARLVRKGGGPVTRVQGVQAGYRLRTPLYDGGTPCHGFFAGYALELEELSWIARLGACRGSFDNETLSATTDEIDVEIELAHAWDLPVVTVDVGVAAGAALLRQAFDTRGQADDRTTGAGHFSAGLGLAAPLFAGLFATADAAGQTYLYRKAEEDGTGSAPGTSFALRVSLGLGAHW